MYRNISRRAALKGGVATIAAALAAPGILRAAETINVGSLTPNTGGGGPFGPKITASHMAAVSSAAIRAGPSSGSSEQVA